ncbi:hypothetical protein C0J52_15934 [Blattella germanica]|nr:hypothetical protein C0J52_15934 [Blattella germanica]
MDGGRSIKNIFEGKFEGRWDRGRPRLRWTDCVERDLCSLGVRNWRRKAENRNEWAIIIKEALAKLLELFANGRRRRSMLYFTIVRD